MTTSYLEIQELELEEKVQKSLHHDAATDVPDEEIGGWGSLHWRLLGADTCAAGGGEDEMQTLGWVVHLLALPNLILLAYLCYSEAQNNQFLPHGPGRPGWWPWSTCFSPVDQYAYCSQYLTDEYTFTHFSHGFVLYFWLVAIPLRFLLPRCFPAWFRPPGKECTEERRFDWLGFHFCALLEIAWEIFENTPAVIEAFRRSGPNSADYVGDSGLNSIGDILACMIGYVLAELLWAKSYEKRRHFGGGGSCWLAFGVTAAYVVAMTVILYFWICDGLVLIWVNLVRPGTITCAAPSHP